MTSSNAIEPIQREIADNPFWMIILSLLKAYLIV
jgi:hypothetical protein